MDADPHSFFFFFEILKYIHKQRNENIRADAAIAIGNRCIDRVTN